DSHPRGRNAEQCDLAAVVHVQEQALECLRHTGHFHPDVEAFGHAQLVHDVAQLLALDVDRAGSAHAPGEIEPVVVDVGDHHIPRADVARDRRRHDADRSGAGNEHVLADKVERQGGVRCVAEGIEDRCQIVGNIVRNLECVEGRDHQILGEGAFAVDPDTDRVWTQVPPPGAAIGAEPAGDVPFAGDAVADLESADFLAHLDDAPDVFVADVHRYRNGFLRPLVPFPDVHVGAAYCGLAYTNQDVVVAYFGLL